MLNGQPSPEKPSHAWVIPLLVVLGAAGAVPLIMYLLAGDQFDYRVFIYSDATAQHTGFVILLDGKALEIEHRQSAAQPLDTVLISKSRQLRSMTARLRIAPSEAANLNRYDFAIAIPAGSRACIATIEIRGDSALYRGCLPAP